MNRPAGLPGVQRRYYCRLQAEVARALSGLALCALLLPLDLEEGVHKNQCDNEFNVYFMNILGARDHAGCRPPVLQVRGHAASGLHGFSLLPGLKWPGAPWGWSADSFWFMFSGVLALILTSVFFYRNYGGQGKCNYQASRLAGLCCNWK